jgi:hypothetical protein
MNGFESANKAPTNPAEEVMDSMMPQAEEKGEKPRVKFKAEKYEGKDLEKKTNGYPEASLSKYKSVANELKQELIEEKGKLEHGSTNKKIGEDGYEYVYLYDEASNPKDRIFRSPDQKVDVAAEALEETVDLYLSGAESVDPKGDEYAKMVEDQMKNNLAGDPPSVAVTRDQFGQAGMKTPPNDYLMIKYKGKYYHWKGRYKE